MTRALRCLALGVAVGGATCAPARADGGVAISAVGQPSYIRLAPHPGRALTAAVRLTNLSQRTTRLRLDPVDVGVAAAGGLSYGTARPLGAGRWLRPRARTVVLAPREERTVAFSVLVPRGTRGGEHFAALTATARPVRVRSGARNRRVDVRFVTRLAIAVRLRLPGRLRTALRVGRASVPRHALPALVLPLSAPGTALLPGARLSLAVTRGGRRLLRIRQVLGAFVPGGRLAFTVGWPGVPAPGRYRLDGTIVAAGRTIAVHQTFAVAAPAHAASAAAPADRAQARPRPPGWAARTPLLAVGVAALGVGAGLGAVLRR